MENNGMTTEALAGIVIESFNKLENRMDQRFSNIEKDLAEVKEDLAGVKNQMVTKDYLDDKLADLRGDLVVLLRKEDTKFLRLVDMLRKKAVLSEEDVEALSGMEPFPQLVLK